MKTPSYKHPPITEAVIEIRFEADLSRGSVEKINKKLKNRYGSSDAVSTVGFSINLKEGEVSRQDSSLGFKLATSDQVDILQILPRTLAWSRLAPYTGWENFQPRAQSDWRACREIVGGTKLGRIGIRYLNRIDIPINKEEQKIRVEDYLTVYPSYPEPNLINGFDQYTLQVQGRFGVDGFNLTINSHVVKSPLINHFSVVLDLDLSVQGEPPQHGDRIWEMVNNMRDHKNSAFEQCITDKARELFSK